MRQQRCLLPAQIALRDQLSCILIGNRLVPREDAAPASVSFWELLRRRAKLLLAATEVMRRVELTAFYDQAFVEQLLNERVHLEQATLDSCRPAGSRLTPFLANLASKLRGIGASEGLVVRRINSFRRQQDECSVEEVLAFLEQQTNFMMDTLERVFFKQRLITSEIGKKVCSIKRPLRVRRPEKVDASHDQSLNEVLKERKLNVPQAKPRSRIKSEMAGDPSISTVQAVDESVSRLVAFWRREVAGLYRVMGIEVPGYFKQVRTRKELESLNLSFLKRRNRSE